ncbi:hypothetical protein [Hymenobacter rubidus]|uniref:hypothetical protein n=1 Tax=Hymenobacter rubidus TaxID=1441626 RepID=UPI00191DF08C|nr:hypothetical protein [Hymenobacter rubidus]
MPYLLQTALLRALGLLLAGLALLSSCNREAWQSQPLSHEADSLIKATLPSARKIVIRAPVNIVVQHGNNNVANPVATGKTKAAAAAIGAGSQATAKPGGTPWWVFGLVAVAGAAGWEWLRSKIPFFSFLKP